MTPARTPPRTIHTCPTPSKLPFSTRGEAKRKIKELSLRKELKPYECRCGAWHLTHRTRGARRRAHLAKLRATVSE